MSVPLSWATCLRPEMTSQQRARLRACALARLAYCGKEERLSFFYRRYAEVDTSNREIRLELVREAHSFCGAKQIRARANRARSWSPRGALGEPSVPFDRFDLADELALRMHVWWASALPAALSGSLHEDIFFWLIGFFRNTNRPLRVASFFFRAMAEAHDSLAATG